MKTISKYFGLLFLLGIAFGVKGQTVTYTVASVSSVTTSGTAPSGSSATYSQTYTTAKQITGSNSATLTLSNYTGYQITSVVLEMHSNASAGAGGMTVVAGATTISSVAASTKFNDAAWYGSWSSPTYVNITKTPSAYTVGGGENVVITINASTNSLYIQSYTITYSGGCTQPTTQATSFTTSSVTANSTTAGWTRGNGDAGVLVLARAGSAVNADPVSGTAYTANAAFGSGTQIGTGNYVVYNSTGTSVNVTSLSPNTAYYYAVYEYNSTGTCYKTPALTGNATTLCNTPATQASGASITNVGSTSFTVNFTAGDGSNHIVLIKSGGAVNSNPVNGTSYTANAAFGSGTQIGTGNYVVYNSTGTSVNVTGLTANTAYYVAVYEFNSGSNCYQTTSPATANITTASAASDVVAVASSESATVSSVINDNAPLTSSTGVQVWQITVRDGGSGLNDADNFPTVVTAITLAQAAGNQVSNWSQAIKTIALFDGATWIANATTVTSNQIQFTGLNLSVADNTQKTFSLRLSLNCGIGAANSDGDDFVFSLSAANFTTATSGSSQKNNSFSAAASTNGKNVITVVATQLAFTTQPVTTGQNQLMSNVVVKAQDACGNLDIDFTGSVSVTSTGTLTGSPVSATASAGVATFTSLIHTATGTALTLTAASTGVTSATSNTFDITTVTNFSVGDIVIIGMCVNMNGCQGSTTIGEDEVSFVSFEDITPGTTIDITDNGYERKNCGSNTWGNTEGVLRLTRTTSTITKGTVVTIRALDQSIFAGVQPDNNWTVSYPNSGYGTFNLNNNDEQVYLMQGGTWNKGTNNTHDATYVGGTLMFGINTYSTWSCNDNSTQRGNLPPALKCFSILPQSGTTQNIKYTGVTTAATQREWIDRFNTPANWTGTNSCATYVASGLDYGGSSQAFTINNGSFNKGVWTGETSVDWFDCENWQDYKVPDSTTNVTVNNVTNPPTVGAPTSLYPDGAFVNNITINSGGGSLTVNNGSSILTIKGDWINSGTVTHSNGRVVFRGASSQSLTGATSFYNLYYQNLGSADLVLSNDVTITNDLKLLKGTITTGSNKLILTNTSASVPSTINSASFINGNFRRYIASNTNTYEFPLGDGTTSGNYKKLSFVNNNLTGISYLEASVNSITQGGSDIQSRLDTTGKCWEDGDGGPIQTPLSNLLYTAQWNLIPDASPTRGSYGVRLYFANVSGLSASDDNRFSVVKRPSSSTDYADWDAFAATTTMPAANASGRTYASGYAEKNGFTSFSKFAIAKAKIYSSPLPVSFLYFKVTKNKNTALLEWTTLTETNNDYFTVEKSTDAVTYQSIGKVKGQGTTHLSHSYTWHDFSPAQGINYYRIKQVDYDGVCTVTPVRSIAFENNNAFFTVIKNEIGFVVSVQENEIISSVDLRDVCGRLIKAGKITDNKIAEISTLDIPAGIYFITLRTQDNAVYSQRVIVSKSN